MPQTTDANFCQAVQSIYVMSGCGPALGSEVKPTAIPVLKAEGPPRKFTNEDFRAAVSRGTGPGLTSLQKTCLIGKDSACVMLHKKNGLGKLPILAVSSLHR
eukprot:TRINITY_DN47450_c0_g1_i1.p1 TRINITY_DN47450_c0_g1~~TRINITY_DN47450_c0_g1_i1.p1  ORF type:complete len:120 (+),score=6.62 TRINITY_DN47450_c0_g1_i1:56-361(+)